MNTVDQPMQVNCYEQPVDKEAAKKLTIYQAGFNIRTAHILENANITTIYLLLLKETRELSQFRFSGSETINDIREGLFRLGFTKEDYPELPEIHPSQIRLYSKKKIKKMSISVLPINREDEGRLRELYGVQNVEDLLKADYQAAHEPRSAKTIPFRMALELQKVLFDSGFREKDGLFLKSHQKISW